jgi:hypothetical protein
MKNSLCLAGTDGLILAEREGDTWIVAGKSLSGHSLSCMIADGSLILAGTSSGLFRSADGGKSWREVEGDIAGSHLRWLASPPEEGGPYLAGTEPAGIYVSHDEGNSWVGCPRVEKLRDTFGWYLPYSPEAGCVRGFALSGPGTHDKKIYAAVEVGGVLVSTDGGTSWDLVEGSDGSPNMDLPAGPLIHPDVHSITVHPSTPDLVTASTGGGLFRSHNGGKSWNCLYRCYCRASWVNPSDPRHILFGPADGVSRGGRIEESLDGGSSWHTASTGLDVPWPQTMVERIFQTGDELLALLSSGDIWSTGLEEIKWFRQLPDSGHVTSIATY